MKMYYSAQELADLKVVGFPSTPQKITLKAKKENWSYQKRLGNGGGKEYFFDSLPEVVKTEILNRDAAADILKKQEEKEQSLMALLKLSQSQFKKVEIKEEILKEYFKFEGENKHLPAVKIRQVFCDKYNNKEVLGDSSIRGYIRSVSSRTLFEWLKNYELNGLSGLSDNYGNRKGQTKVDAQKEVKEFILGVIYHRPTIKCDIIMRGLRERFDRDILPSYRTVQNWVQNWKAENAATLLAIQNPDAWRNKYQAAAGSQSEKIVRLNQRWEFDSTPTDILLNDGARHNIVGVIDVYSRRLKLLVSNTSNSTAVASITRACLLDWGVPEEVKTDNGADYASKYMRRVFETLEVKQLFCRPFTPEGKPHIERVFKTFSHDVLELLPGYIGHNVAERKDIEARKSFADHIMGNAKRNFKEYLSPEELQEFCDNWIKNYYMQEPHRGLNGATPQSMVDEYQGEIRRIQNERALDILLSTTSGDGLRTVTKKGIAIDNAYYDSNDLVLYIGRQVKVLYAEGCWSKVYVFTLDGEFITEAYCPERAGISRAEVANAKKALQKKVTAESKKIIKDYSKKYMVEHLADELISQKAVTNPKLLAFPKPEVSYESKFLKEAENILKSQDMPQGRELTTEEQAFLSGVEKARIDNIVSMPESVLATQKYNRWKQLNIRFLKGERLSQEEREFYANYKESSEFKNQVLLEDLKIQIG